MSTPPSLELDTDSVFNRISQPKQSPLEAGIRGAAQSATLGTAPYFGALYSGALPGTPDYNKQLAEEKAAYRSASEQQPIANLVGGFVGGLPSALATGTGSMLRQVGMGAGIGAIGGAAQSEDWSQVPLSSATGAGIGGTLIGGLNLAGKAGSKVIGAFYPTAESQVKAASAKWAEINKQTAIQAQKNVAEQKSAIEQRFRSTPGNVGTQPLNSSMQAQLESLQSQVPTVAQERTRLMKGNIPATPAPEISPGGRLLLGAAIGGAGSQFLPEELQQNYGQIATPAAGALLGMVGSKNPLTEYLTNKAGKIIVNSALKGREAMRQERYQPTSRMGQLGGAINVSPQIGDRLRSLSTQFMQGEQQTQQNYPMSFEPD